MTPCHLKGASNERSASMAGSSNAQAPLLRSASSSAKAVSTACAGIVPNSAAYGKICKRQLIVRRPPNGARRLR